MQKEGLSLGFTETRKGSGIGYPLKKRYPLRG